MMTVLRKLFFGCFILLAGFVGAVCYLTMTTSGLRSTLQLASHFSAEPITIRQVSGKLAGSFTLSGILYGTETSATCFKAERLTLTWSPLALLHGVLHINTMTLSHASVQIQKKPDSNALADKGALPASSLKEMLASSKKHTRIDRIKLERVNIHFSGNSFTLDGSMTDQWQLHFAAALPDLSAFSRGLSGNLQASGTISGKLLTPQILATLDGKSLQLANDSIGQLHATLNLPVQPDHDSTLQISASKLAIASFPLKNADIFIHGHLSRDKKNLSVILHLQLLKNISARLALNFPEFSASSLNQPVNGTLHAAFAIEKLRFLIPKNDFVTRPSGQISATLLLQGTPQHPLFSGTATLNNGMIDIPRAGTRLTNISLNLALNTRRLLQLNGKFSAGKGSGILQGTLDAGNTACPLNLHIEGSELSALHLPDYQILISPNISLQFVNNQLTVNGNIDIPAAKLAPEQFSNAVTLPDEVIFTDARQTAPPPVLPFTTAMQLTITLGKKIHIARRDLDAVLAGSLQIIEVPGGAITASGQLHTIQGSWHAYGQSLSIQRGRLYYTGGLLGNPALDIEAVKKIRSVALSNAGSGFAGSGTLPGVYTGEKTITAGIRITGMLNGPVITLFSDPPMSQADIVSWLVFGYPQSEISSHAAGTLLSLLSSAGPTNGLSGMGSNLQQGVMQKLGFTELGLESTQVFDPVTTSTVSTTTLGIGKQLSPRLSLHYSAGLFYPVSILNLRYTLSRHWSIQSENSTIDNGADLLFSIEKD